MGEVIDGGAADIHAHARGIERGEIVFRLGERVEKADRHGKTRKAEWFRQTETRGNSAANSRSNLTERAHAASPFSRASTLARPIRGSSFFSSGPSPRPVRASRRGW